MKISLRYLVIASVSVFLLFSPFAYGSIYDVFSDVKDPYSYYYGPVYAMSKLGVITGYEDGRFGPDDSMTRAQVATVLQRYHEKVVWPLVKQVGALHSKGRSELHGASWEEYLQNYEYYDFKFSLGGEGTYDGYNFDFDVFNDVIAGSPVNDMKVVYSDTEEFDGIEFGRKIIQAGSSSIDGEHSFVIWTNSEIFGERVYGEFSDDVDRLVAEAKAAG